LFVLSGRESEVHACNVGTIKNDAATWNGQHQFVGVETIQRAFMHDARSHDGHVSRGCKSQCTRAYQAGQCRGQIQT
jgi:hypothetical protein